MATITKIHNKYYDFSNFIHPGGNTAIWHAFGRDATTLFESYHPFADKDKMQSILKKYEIKSDLNDRKEEHFTYDSAFAKELKAKVKKYFDQLAIREKTTFKQAMKASLHKRCMIFLLFCLHCAGYYLHFKGYKCAMFFLPLFSWIFIVNSFHDAAHFALSNDASINAFFSNIALQLTQSLDWYHQHNIGHHCDTNIAEKDPDLYQTTDFLRYHTSIKWKPFYESQSDHFKLFLILFYYSTFACWGLIFLRSYEMISTTFYHTVKFYKQNISIKDFIGFICMKFLYVFVHFLWPFHVFESTIFAFVYIMVSRGMFSLFFMACTQINHIHTDCMVENQKDWYAHQVESSANFSIGSKLTFFLCGGLNYQIEHHLFPSVNHEHLPHIQPIVQQLCKKHNVNYKHFLGYKDAFKSYTAHLIRMGKKT